MAKRLLVPLDRTAEAESLIPLVADTARGGGATVRLLHVSPVPYNVVGKDGRVVAYTDQEMSRIQAERLDYLRTIELQLGDVPVDSVVRFGDTVEEILREADVFGADLIAVTTTCRSGITRRLLGSVAEKLLRKTSIPVLLLRPEG